MLSENMKAIRKSKGLSQQELAVRLNVVRQTISKWEQGLSVPDSDMLISISEALETRKHTAWRNGYGNGGRQPEGYFRKIGSDKLAAGAARKRKKKIHALALYFIMRHHHHRFYSPYNLKEPLFKLGLQRP